MTPTDFLDYPKETVHAVAVIIDGEPAQVMVDASPVSTRITSMEASPQSQFKERRHSLAVLRFSHGEFSFSLWILALYRRRCGVAQPFNARPVFRDEQE